jgi:hypothetical protein
MAYSEAEILELSKRIGKNRATLWRWAKEGCDLRSHASVQSWIEKKRTRETNVEKARRRKEAQKIAAQSVNDQEPAGNGETLPPAGKRGAAAALERLENQEEEAHRRLQAALSRGNPIQIQAAQEFWLRCSETLRRLDLAVETARREAETQVPLRVAQEAVTAASEWLRISVSQFLSSETTALMAFKDGGEFRAYFIERLRGIVHLTMKNTEQTNSAIPDWAIARIKAAWNVQ